MSKPINFSLHRRLLLPSQCNHISRLIGAEVFNCVRLSSHPNFPRKSICFARGVQNLVEPGRKLPKNFMLLYFIMIFGHETTTTDARSKQVFASGISNWNIDNRKRFAIYFRGLIRPNQLPRLADYRRQQRCTYQYDRVLVSRNFQNSS